MRPIRLTMTAFGPYKDTETIDFKELEDIQLFVISGTTGAGKTTIFDAICFGLYGSASGTDRENMMMLRSHFADDEVHTKVEFVFEIKERTYRVLRQIGHVKTGNKTKTGEKYELYEQLGTEEIPCVDRQKVTEVNEKIEQLIGLTEDQFKQIVMLPQGEFRKLLTSETENKEEILRRLFNTVKFQHINAYLKEKRDDVMAEWQQEQLQLNQTMRDIHGSITPFEGSQVFDILHQEHYEAIHVQQALKSDMAYFEKRIVTDEQAYQTAYTAHQNIQKDYHAGLELNKRFEELQEKKQTFEQMKQQKQGIEVKEKQLKQANHAHQLKPYETQFITTENEWRERKNTVQRQQAAVQDIEKEFKKAEDRYEAEKKQETTRDKLKINLQKYTDFLPVVEESEQVKDKLHLQKSQLQKRESQLERGKNQRKVNHTSLQQLKHEIKQQETKASKENELYLALEHVKKQFGLLDRYQKLISEKTELAKQVSVEKKSYEEAVTQYKQYEVHWLNAQAAILADSLSDNEACPVCGSTHHPQVAMDDKHGVTKETLEEKRKETELAKEHYEKLANKMEVTQTKIQEKTDELAQEELTPANNLQGLQQQIDNVVTQGRQMRKAYEDAKSIRETLTKNKERLEQLEESQEQTIQSLEALEKQYYTEQTAYTSLQASFTEKLSAIPTALQDINMLKKAIDNEQTALNKHLQAWEDAKNTLERVKEKKQTLTATLENQAQLLKALDEKVKESHDVFQTKMKEAGFVDKATYDEAKMADEEREKVAQTIDDFQRQFYAMQEQITDTEKALVGQSPINMETMKEKMETLKNQYEKAFQQWNNSTQQREAAASFMERIERLSKTVAYKEKQAGIIADVHDVLRGQNDLKVSFERYLQIDYLDNIIEAANQRFQELMNGQFYLMRSDKQASHGRQSGLAIDVFDGYTGQTRDVKTLSGGEKFIASLCLALGMSDVIQSFQGSISMETMFIDEGFGSLDEESLQKAIQVLVQLQQSGRLIGVISHVEELKTIFPAMLQVTKTKDGHSKASFKFK